jgi:hypothetical protein
MSHVWLLIIPLQAEDIDKEDCIADVFRRIGHTSPAGLSH